jgi:hypothetical protein
MGISPYVRRCIAWPTSTCAAVALLPGSWRGQYSTIAYLAQPTKRQSQADNDDYEPTLAATTKDLGDARSGTMALVFRQR